MFLKLKKHFDSARNEYFLCSIPTFKDFKKKNQKEVRLLYIRENSG